LRPPNPAPIRRGHVSLLSTQERALGEGFLSGVASVGLGALGLAAVLCLRFPSYLTMPELRGLYPIPYVRALLHLVLVAAFVLGAASVCLRYNKALGLTGLALTLTATLLGGSRVPLDGELTKGPFLGLDWSLLTLIGYSAVYVPLERLFARDPAQPILRRGFRTDLAYFFVSSLLVQLTTLLTMKPAMVLFDGARPARLAAWVSGLPFLVQVFALLFVADLTQYWVHRAFHTWPWLWRFHAIHHSAEQMDWLAGSRLHLVDAVATRAITYVPIYLLGFSEAALFAYVLWVVVQATSIHANVRWRLRPLRRLLATPAFHHWHHSAEPEAVDKNFAVHLPVLDCLFGTYYLPDRWPHTYGLAEGGVPDGYFRQTIFPFRLRRATPGA
jgi:sterol desaturase/sphingolipid hydroxylase (fatty acid hydroxylase superfamily)